MKLVAPRASSIASHGFGAEFTEYDEIGFGTDWALDGLDEGLAW